MPADLSLLADVPILQLLDDDERATLASLLDQRHYDAGAAIFREGDAGDALFLVSSGGVEVSVTSDTGERVVLAQNDRGDVFGEISLLDGGPRTASAVATQDTEVLTLSRANLFELVVRRPHVAIDLLTVMGRRLRATDELLRTRVSRNVNEEADEALTFGQRVADRVAAFGGSWTFIISFGTFLAIWVVINTALLATKAFDPYPYILLNLFLSMLAALQAPVIMMSQNRQSAKDRLKADLDYDINLKSELEVAQLHRKLDHLTERFEAQAAQLPLNPRTSAAAPVLK